MGHDWIIKPAKADCQGSNQTFSRSRFGSDAAPGPPLSLDLGEPRLEVLITSRDTRDRILRDFSPSLYQCLVGDGHRWFFNNLVIHTFFLLARFFKARQIYRNLQN